MHASPSTPLLYALQDIVGSPSLITDPSQMASYVKGFRFGQGKAAAVVIPKSLVELWRVAKACVQFDHIIIMQASNTGLTGGSTPYGEYDRPVILISTVKLKGIQLIQNGKQAIALPGSTLFELEDLLAPLQREPHSVIGSSCIGASIIGGICNNSGGALVHRGPAYTEQALYARLNENSELELINHLDIELGNDPETILNQLEKALYQPSDVKQTERKASDDGYGAKVRDVNANTPARFNNNHERLFEASGSAGRLIVFAVRIDTFEKPAREQVFYIGTNDTQVLTDIRRHILQNFKSLPVSGEYLHRDYFNVSERYGRDGFLVIDKLGSKAVPKFLKLKNSFDRLVGKLGLSKMSDKIVQFFMELLPSHLPKAFREIRDQYEHHLILKMENDGVDEARDYLDKKLTGNVGRYHWCTPEEGEKAILHRFVAAQAAKRYHLVDQKRFGDILALDIALRRNEDEWFEKLPPELDSLIAEKLYCGHFFCHVMHQDYLLKPNTNAMEIKDQLLAFFDAKGAEYPAEHNVGHLYHAKSALRDFYQTQDPTNSLNPGIGKTPKGKHWQP
ncbi:MAG: D-lactate dehydrogenase [Cardiobacteriaceae bacterium]|nr:D-lactate dehydrogenase [Cardiobacteriaceae bacterium]